jgi:hypothetical protein
MDLCDIRSVIAIIGNLGRLAPSRSCIEQETV